MAKIYLVRHCEAEGNATRRTQAHAEALVTVKGYEQSEYLRRRLHGVKIDAVYSSDAFRAIKTAEPIALERDLPLKVSIALREVTTGVWEDMSWGNIAEEYPDEHRHWKNTPWDVTTPGASSFQEVAERMVYRLRKIAREVGEDGVALAVSHSCAIKAAQCMMLGKPMTCVKEMGHGENTSITLLDIDMDGNITVEYMNDASHLPKNMRRTFEGKAAADVNMAIYPATFPKDMPALLELARMDAEEKGKAFDPDAYSRYAENLLAEHPGFIAIAYLHQKPAGFVLMEFDPELPKSCAVLKQMYVLPYLQGQGYVEQLFGHAAWHLRYNTRVNTVAVRCDGSAEELRVTERFVFERMLGHDAYRSLYLFCPPCSYPLLF